MNDQLNIDECIEIAETGSDGHPTAAQLNGVVRLVREPCSDEWLSVGKEWPIPCGGSCCCTCGTDFPLPCECHD